jgi:hypothetical protein
MKLPILKPIILAWASRKFWSTLLSFGLMWGIHVMTVGHIYAVLAMRMPDAVTTATVSALVTLYTVTLGVIGVIIASFLGSSAFSSKFGISGAASIAAQALTESREEHIVSEQIIKDMSERYKDDPSYRPIQPDTEETFR